MTKTNNWTIESLELVTQADHQTLQVTLTSGTDKRYISRVVSACVTPAQLANYFHSMATDLRRLV